VAVVQYTFTNEEYIEQHNRQKTIRRTIQFKAIHGTTQLTT